MILIKTQVHQKQDNQEIASIFSNDFKANEMMHEVSPFPSLVEVDLQRCNLSHPELQYDESCLLVSSTASSIVSFLAQSSECLECDLLEWTSIEPNTTVPLLIKSKFAINFSLELSKNEQICSLKQAFGGKGVFELNINSSSCSDIITLQEPADTFLPLIITILVYLGLCLSWLALSKLVTTEWFKRISTRNSTVAEMENDLGSPSTSELPNWNLARLSKQTARVKSLDTFRGLSIALMIFVNYGGGKYTIFEHSIWDGLTFADILFPSFMWIMGLSMAISLRSQLRSGITRSRLTAKVVKRSLMLMAIGISLNSFGHNDLRTLRLPGVLQRLGVCYLIVGVIEAAQMKLQNVQQPVPRVCSWLQDLIDAWPQWLLVIAITGIHTVLTLALPVPGCPKGYMGPGGLHEHGRFVNCTGGAAGYIDQLAVGSQHMYQRPTCRKIYRTVIPYDPEGLLGTMTSVLLVYLGVQAGRIMLTFTNPWSRLLRWIIWSLITGMTAGILCGFAKEGGFIPINKNLNSLSFVLGNAALDFALLALLYFIVDMHHSWSGEPFSFAGMNPLLLYIGHEITSNMLPWRWQPLTSSQHELLAMHAWGATLWLFIAYLLHQANFFFSI